MGGTFALLVVAGGSAVAAAEGSAATPVYQACLSQLRVLYNVQQNPSKVPTCARGDALISWNQTGPAGAQGPQGEKGDPGAVGPAGPQGETGGTGATGAQGTAGEPGPKGDTGTAGADGKDGVSVMSQALDPGEDSTCPNGGSKFTAAGGNATYACTGATGPAGPPGPQGPAGPSAGADVSGSALAGSILMNSTNYMSANGPTVAVTIPSGHALVTIGAAIIPTSGNCAYESFAVDGGIASDVQSLSTCTSRIQASATYLVGLAPGSHTFAAQYRISGGGTATFESRTLIVTPLP